jgi:hypothetical protein
MSIYAFASFPMESFSVRVLVDVKICEPIAEL